ncbi:unnamed protein product [Durusdinium trenchii]|uniref:Uncharacterized protein n=1 Tax=Durusdinium trenchii TaxID=1381693 RepID=A0ABP0SHK7_9DINO
MIIEDFRPATERQHSSFVRLVSKFRVRLIEPPQLHEALLAKMFLQAMFDTPLPLNDLVVESISGLLTKKQPRPSDTSALSSWTGSAECWGLERFMLLLNNVVRFLQLFGEGLGH